MPNLVHCLAARASPFYLSDGPFVCSQREIDIIFDLAPSPFFFSIPPTHLPTRLAAPRNATLVYFVSLRFP